jgi:hypothetical protein
MATRLKTRAALTVGTSAIKLFNSAPYPVVKQLFVSVPAANTNIVSMGDSDVSATRGFQFPSGSRTTVILSNDGKALDVDSIYVLGGAAAQSVEISYLEEV